MIDNPFVINGYVGDEYFCDREEQTRTLIELLDNGNNVVITAPRRIGKSDFISHVFAQPQIAQDYTTIDVDIYAAQSMTDFVDFLGKAIVKALRPRGRAIVEGFVHFLKSLQPQMTFDINGIPTWGIGVSPNYHPETTLDEIFEYLNNSDRPCVVAIDEFQQITRFPDPWRVEAMLRTYIQKCRNARFIFCGSHRHLMAEIFTSPSRPFYASVSFITMPKLDPNTYTDFCVRLFGWYNKSLDPETVTTVYEVTQGVTAYMQRIMSRLFTMTGEHDTCHPNAVDTAIAGILRSNDDVYTTLFNMLTPRQRQVLLAIAREGEATGIQSAAFVKKYNLGTPSMVGSAVKALLDKDLLTHDSEGYCVYDMFFKLWLVDKF